MHLFKDHTHTGMHGWPQPVVVIIMEKKGEEEEGEKKTYRTGIIPNETFLDVVS